MATTKKKTITKSSEPEEALSPDTSSDTINSPDGAVDTTTPEDEKTEDKKLVATRLILYRSRLYDAEDELPADDTEMVEAWLKYGSAKWVSKEPEAVMPKAEMKSAEPGLLGKTENGEKDVDGNNLVGKVPKTAQRKK